MCVHAVIAMADAFSEDHRRLIAGQSMTLVERLADPGALEEADSDTEAVEEVLDEWRELFPSERAFERRLDRLGATEDDCRQAIRSGTLAPGEPIPEWLDALDDLVAFVHGSDPADFRVDDGRRDDQQWLFGEVSAAVAAYARERIDEPATRDVLSEAAVDSMAEWLRTRFQNQFTRLLYVEFKTFVARHDRERALADPDEYEEPPTEYYDRFIDLLFDGGFGDLCLAYPVFARLLVSRVRQWADHLLEFVRRARADRELLEQRFEAGESLGRVRELEPLADDTHGDGRAVTRVTFESGTTVVYKPRSVDAGEAFYRTLDRLADHLPIPAFETPAYLVRDGYGWMEWIEYEGCPDERAVERYYRRAGALCCLCYFFEFTDNQVENLIAVGEHPLLVDAETVMHPHIDPERAPVVTSSRAPLKDTVFLTALLPVALDYAYDGSYGDSMLGSISGFSTSSQPAEVPELQVPRIRAPNSDVVSVAHEPAEFDRAENVPTVDGEDCPPAAYIDAFADGFEATYEAVLDCREDRLFEEVGLLEAFESVENRVLYRSTVSYVRIIEELSSRHCLADGVRFGLPIEALTVPFCDGRVVDPPWELFEAERRALKRLDPPRFTSRTDGTRIEFDGDAVGMDADQSGLDRTRERIEAANRDDLREQMALARASFGDLSRWPGGGDETRADVRPSADSQSAHERADDDQSALEAVDDGQFVREAEELFSRVRSAAATTASGTPHWVSAAPRDKREEFTLEVTNGSLYTGRSGIALLAAALYRVTGDDQYRTFALETLRPIRESLQMEDGGVFDLEYLGGALGIGSVAYGLGAVGELLEAPGVLDDATRIADRCTQDLIEADETYDVMGGSAGQILGFLGLYDRVDDDAVLASAVDCGDHLLDSRVRVDGVRVWETVDNTVPLTGFSHGVSGIAYALVRLGDATGVDAYQEAAFEALEYERRTYSEREQNWLDFRDATDDDTYPDTWCHGRTGIGLARLGIAESVPDERVLRDIERAVVGVRDSGLEPFDHLCCGESGRTEFLLAAATRQPELSAVARARQAAVLARKRERGAYRIRSTVAELADPRFFHGLSGIGYTMLRVTEPDTLPNVLLWE